eukprot:g808.t1
MSAEAADITIDHETDGSFTIVRPVGKLDTISAKSFEAYLKSLVDQNAGTLLVDMENVDYVTSFGLRSLLIIAKLLAPSGDKLILFQLNVAHVETVTVRNDLADLPAIYAALEAFAAAVDLPDATRRTLLLIVEELFSNIVSYGYPDGTDDEITISARCGQTHVELTLADKAVPFDSDG